MHSRPKLIVNYLDLVIICIYLKSYYLFTESIDGVDSNFF